MMGGGQQRGADGPCGVLVVDKPAGLTSSTVVQEVRRRLGVRKAGHAGTLDPLATGVLPVCLEEATKIAGLLLAEDKEYAGRARLGVQTDTLDITGRVLAERDPSTVTRTDVERAMAALRGTIAQTPPAFSAVHSGGKRAHALARRGEVVVLAPREVVVQRFELLEWAPPEFGFFVACGKGTYVRSLVRDVGLAVGSGAALSALRRVRCGSFAEARAVPLTALSPEAREADLGRALLTMDEALAHLPAVEVSSDDARRLRLGQALDLEAPPGLLRLRHGGQLVALGERRKDRLWPTRVFNK